MNLSELFIRRPVATSLLMVAIALFGFVAYRALPVSDLPIVDFPTISVSASLPGASPETMASSVATPLEKQFSTIAGVDSDDLYEQPGQHVRSLCSSRWTAIWTGPRRTFSPASLALRGRCRRGCRSPPSFRKVNPADMPIFFLALTSDTLPLYELNEYADTMMAQRISMVSGVAQVQIMGSANRAVRIQVDPPALAAKGIGIDELAAAVRSWNVNMPTGELYGPTRTYTIQASGQLVRAEEYRSLVVAYRNGRPVRLEEVAKVIDSLEDDKSASWYYDKEQGSSRGDHALGQKQPGTNTIAGGGRRQGVGAWIPATASSFRQAGILYDRSRTIRESFHDIQFTMLLTLGLVVLVIFLFLRNVSATLIPSLALPFSIIGTFAVMYLLGYSLNNLSMMALILSVGFVVDDAIVMLENIVRHMEHGESAMAASLTGSRGNRLHDPVHDPVARRPSSFPCSSWAASWDGCSRSLPSPSPRRS